VTIDFDQVIAPMARAEFLRDYWDKSFVRIPGMPGRFADLLRWDELNAILEQHRLMPPRLKLFQNGQAVDPQRFLTPTMFGVPRLDAGGLAACLAQGATLILDDVQEIAPRVQALMHTFQDVMHTDTYANLYASWHGQNGFDLHWDPVPAFILQLVGRKRWQVFGPTRKHPLEGDEQSSRPTGAPLWDGILEDGDTLYIPRGWWHVAFPINEPSLHLTVSPTLPNGIDFLGWAIRKLRAQEDARANLPVLAGTAALAAQAKKLRGLMDEVLTGDSATEFLREWQANIRPTPRIRLQDMPYRQGAAVEPESRVRLAALNRLFLTPDGANFAFKAAGRSWSVPAELAEALGMLTNTRAFSVAELSAKVSGPAALANLQQAIGVLARGGVVLIEGSD
jgi:ribosomal protein L16 Arg81 hydroxylase